MLFVHARNVILFICFLFSWTGEWKNERELGKNGLEKYIPILYTYILVF